jgi:hypothetical protein
VVHLVVVTGTLTIWLALALCGEADNPTASQHARCETTTSIAVPLAIGYFATVVVSWLIGLGLEGRNRRRRIGLGSASARQFSSRWQ